MNNKNISHYNLWSKLESDNEFDFIDSVADTITNASIEVTEYDQRYEFTMSIVSTEGYETPYSEAQSIVPGPFNYWVSDYYQDFLMKITYDGAHVIFQRNIYFPICLEVYSKDKTLWLAIDYPPQLRKLDSNGQTLLTIDLPENPGGLAINQSSGDVFVSMKDNPELLVFSITGEPSPSLYTGIHLTRSTTMAIDSSNSLIWISVPDSNKVIKMNYSTGIIDTIFDSFTYPKKIKILGNLEVSCIATDSGLVMINPNNTHQLFLEGNNIIDMDVNEMKNEFWMILYNEENFQSNIKILSKQEDNWEITSFNTTNNYQYLTSIKVNPGINHPGILLLEYNTSQLIRLNELGEKLGSMSPLSSRLSIGIEQ